jgi:uncharacterized membrane protein
MSFKRGWYERINQNSTLLEEIMAVAKKAAAKKAVAKKSVEIETRHIGVDWRSLYLYAVCLIFYSFFDQRDHERRFPRSCLH